jgi:hypothetical protein
MWAFHLWTSYDSFSLLLIQKWKSIHIWIPFAFYFHLCLHLYCEIIDFVDFKFPFICRNSMMKNETTCPFIIWLKLSITSSCNSWENATFFCTQQHLIITFVLSNNLHYIYSTCKVVHLVMVRIGMNYCWIGPVGQMILLNLRQMSQITCPSIPWQIAYHTWREKRFLGLPSDMLIILLA